MSKRRASAPETVRIPLSDGDWIEVKKRLTYGESTRMKASLYDITAAGALTPNLNNTQSAQAVAYLVDWSLRDHEDQVIPIDTPQRLRAGLDALNEEDAAEVIAAVERHVEAMDAERAAKKSNPDGESGSSPSLPSAA